MAKPQTTCLYCSEKSSCFHQLNDNELTLADESKVQVQYKKGETIAKQDSFITHILYVKTGHVKVYREIEDGTNIIYSILPQGSLIGLSALYYLNTFQYSIAALTDSKICAIDKKVIETIFKDNGDFSQIILETLNEEIHQLREKMVSLTHKQMEGRLADSLLFLKEKIFQTNKFKITLSRKELAEFSGMSTMSVVRTIQSLIKKSLIKEDSGYLSVIDESGLRDLSCFT